MPRQTTSPADYPQAVLQQIEQLAQNIVIARKRRGESQAQWAKKLGISQPTMARIERGDPSVAMASYVMCMWLINQASGLADLIAPQHDHAALEKEVEKVAPKNKKNAAHTAKQTPKSVSQAVSTSTTSSSGVKTVGTQHTALNGTTGLGGLIARVVEQIAQQQINADKSASAGLAALLAKSDPKKK